jgi:predicted GNAT superfamily acetyltransferase
MLIWIVVPIVRFAFWLTRDRCDHRQKLGTVSKRLAAALNSPGEDAVATIEAMLALNEQNEEETSRLDGVKLAAMLKAAFWWEACGETPDALLIAFDQDANYDSANFAWFAERYRRFVYVDRVIVAARARGQGIARQIYARLAQKAEQAGHDRIVCEINLEPANPGSIAFHDALGFAEVGQARLANGNLVSYREWPMAARS